MEKLLPCGWLMDGPPLRYWYRRPTSLLECWGMEQLFYQDFIGHCSINWNWMITNDGFTTIIAGMVVLNEFYFLMTVLIFSKAGALKSYNEVTGNFNFDIHWVFCLIIIVLFCRLIMPWFRWKCHKIQSNKDA